jgi:hypothetical protein
MIWTKKTPFRRRIATPGESSGNTRNTRIHIAMTSAAELMSPCKNNGILI